MSQPECDSLLPKYLGDGVINLTDGASPYEALAGGVCGAHTRVTVMTVLREHGLKGALNAAVGA